MQASRGAAPSLPAIFVEFAFFLDSAGFPPYNSSNVAVSAAGRRLTNMEEELDNIITLSDENGQDVRFEFLDLIEYQEERYVILLPTDEEDDETSEVVILRLDDTDEEELESYVSVEDEDTLNAVFDIFKERFKDEFNFED